jgi:hypothetical protein
MRFLLPALAAAALAAGGCGYVGDPQPPLANIPAGVQDLGAVERGSTLFVQFSVPAYTTENNPIKKPLKLDLRIGTSGPSFNAEAWAAAAQPVPNPKLDQHGTARYEIPCAEWIGKEAILGVRAIGANGKESKWSNFVRLPVIAPPEKPAGLRLTPTPQGVQVAWTARGENFRLFRRVGDETAFTPVVTVQRTEWTDPATEFGKRYAYRVRNIVKLAGGREAESEPSEEAAITPEDVFPPPVPTGLAASVAPNSIELSWVPGAAANLAGYRVYRSAAGGPMEKIADVPALPAYSDRAAGHGKTYRYAVSAVSKAGNESARSEAVEAALP